MELNEILEELKTNLNEAKKDIANAKVLGEIGKEAGISVVKFNIDIRNMETEANKFDKALSRRLNGSKKKA